MVGYPVFCPILGIAPLILVSKSLVVRICDADDTSYETGFQFYLLLIPGDERLDEPLKTIRLDESGHRRPWIFATSDALCVLPALGY